MTKEKLITNIRSYLCYCDDAKYRIKQSEPTLEYQWYRIRNDSGAVEILNLNAHNGKDQFFTEDEVDTKNWTRFNETKRERK